MRKHLIMVALLSLWSTGCTPYDEGLRLMKEGQYEKAAEFFIRLTEQRPHDPRAFHELGYAYTRLKMYGDAVAAYQKALELKPDYVESLANLGYVYLLDRRQVEAEAPLLKAVELKPDCETCHANLAWVYFHLRQAEKAESHFKTAVSLSGGKRNYEDLAQQIAQLKARMERLKQKPPEMNSQPPASLEEDAPVSPQGGESPSMP